jgi:diguanylate cyclase
MSARLRFAVRIGWALGLLGLCVLIVAGPERAADNLWAAAGLFLVYLVAVVTASAGAFIRRREGVAWLLLAIALATFAATAFTYAIDPSAVTRFPSIADVGLFVFYPFAMATLVLRVRATFTGFGLVNWMDSSISAFAIAALGAPTLLPSSLGAIAGAQLSYVIGDLVLIGFIAATFAALGRQAMPALWLFAVGVAILTVGDVDYVGHVIAGHISTGLIPALAWPTGVLILASAATVWPSRRGDGGRIAARTHMAIPLLSAMVCLPIALLAAHENAATVVLAGVALLAVLARLSMSLREHKRLVHRLSEANNDLAHAAEHDVLTGLGNRARLARVAEDGALAAGRVLVLVDLDEFKAINDTFGHAAGDQVLQAVAERLRGAVRPEDLVVRLGGDEFAALLSAADEGVSRAVAARFLATLEEPLTIDGQTIFVRASVGVAIAAPGESLAALLPHADASMYRAKSSSGLEQVSVFDPTTHHQVLDNLALATDLRGALARSELILHYQAIVDMANRATVGFEALVRWQHPERGMVPPGVFIPLAEQGGLMPEIGEWILEQACRDATTWRAAGSEAPYVSVNLSVRQLQDPDFLARFNAALERSGMLPESLVVEVTETALAIEHEAIRAPLDELRRLGVRVYIDDFGTGYSSLGYIRDLPLDGVKLDQAFARDLTTSAEAWALAQAIIALLGNLNLALTAEGVESAAQLAQLRSLGCEHAQGYYFARPQPPDGLDDLLRPPLVEVLS